MYAQLVSKFTRACGSLKEKPVLMDETAKQFISEMVNDELQELFEANTIVDQADALVDAIVYILDCACRHGVDLDPLLKIVMDANNSKIVDGKVIRREDGKVMKPEGWVAPEPKLEEEINRQIREGNFKE